MQEIIITFKTVTLTVQFNKILMLSLITLFQIHFMVRDIGICQMPTYTNIYSHFAVVCLWTKNRQGNVKEH